MGSLEAGKLANFVITSGPVFDEKTIFFQNWVQGRKYILTENGWNDYRGNYKLTLNTGIQHREFVVEVKGSPDKPAATLQPVGDTVKTDASLTLSGKLVRLTWSRKADSSKLNSLTGLIDDKLWVGNGYSAEGDVLNWNMQYSSPYIEKPDTAKKKEEKKALISKNIPYPFNGYGRQPARMADCAVIAIT